MLEAKDQERDEDEPQPSGTQAENDFGNTVHVKLQKVVTIADSPDIPRQQINVGDPPIPQLSPGSLSSHNDNDDPTSLVHHTEPSLPELSTNSPSQSRQSKELSMIAEADEPGERSRQSMQSHHPDEDIMDDMEATVPIREDGSTHTLIGKASVSQFVVPAPSPLKKSIRPSREHSGGTLPAPTLSQTPGSVFAGKRTSWLTKAKETRALEMTGSGKAPYSERTTFLSATLNAAANSAKRKSGEMLGLGSAASTVENLQTAGEDDRQFKVPRLTPTAEMESDSTSKDVEMEDGQYPHSKSQAPLANEPISDNVRIAAKVTPAMMDDFTVPLADVQSDEGVLDRLKRTVEDLGARTAKSMGKSLGGGAAAELAEARAAALARVAERNKEDGVEVIIDPAPDAAHPEADLKTGSPEVHTSKSSQFNISASNQDDDRRFSLSDLVISSKSKVDQQSTTNSREFPDAANISTSTTPPCSPPPTKKAPDAPHPPVFSKPSVFSAPSSGAQQSQRLPVSTSDNDFSFKLPRTNPFSLPAAMALGVPATLPSSSNQIPALSAHSSKGSIFSDAIFDKQDDHPSWMPRTQDTDYSTQLSQVPDDLEDEDDSYRVDPSLKANQMWTPFGLASEKDDTMTWSTLPSRSTSQKGGDTGPVPTEDAQQALDEASHRHFIQPPSDDEGNKAQLEIDQADLDIGVGDMSLDNDLDDIVASGKATITLVEVRFSLFVAC